MDSRNISMRPTYYSSFPMSFTIATPKRPKLQRSDDTILLHRVRVRKHYLADVCYGLVVNYYRSQHQLLWHQGGPGQVARC
jgi:hypothetical protein